MISFFPNYLTSHENICSGYIGGFRGGAKGAAPLPPIFFYHIHYEFAFTLHHEYAHNAVCCMSLKVKFPFRRVRGGGGGGKGPGPLILNFLDPPLGCILV